MFYTEGYVEELTVALDAKTCAIRIKPSPNGEVEIGEKKRAVLIEKPDNKKDDNENNSQGKSESYDLARLYERLPAVQLSGCRQFLRCLIEAKRNHDKLRFELEVNTQGEISLSNITYI